MGDNKWRKSSRTGGGDNQNCVEARLSSGEFLVRDSKLGEASPVLTASAADWRIFLTTVAKLPTLKLVDRAGSRQAPGPVGVPRTFARENSICQGGKIGLCSTIR
jgi:hypothetical protein